MERTGPQKLISALMLIETKKLAFHWIPKVNTEFCGVRVGIHDYTLFESCGWQYKMDLLMASHMGQYSLFAKSSWYNDIIHILQFNDINRLEESILQLSSDSHLIISVLYTIQLILNVCLPLLLFLHRESCMKANQSSLHSFTLNIKVDPLTQR